MTTMTERLARAMYERHKGPEQSWETIDAFWYKTYMEKARAALEELKKPTAKIQAAFYDGYDEKIADRHEPTDENINACFANGWANAITAALEEGE